jgi:hypothetical protein
MTTPITLDEVRAVAQQVVVDFGPKYRNPGIDDEYGTCRYTTEDGAHCIAGQIAENMGVPVPGIDSRNNEDVVKDVTIWRGIFTAEAEFYLAEVQKNADQGSPWADAVRIVEADMVDNTV